MTGAVKAEAVDIALMGADQSPAQTAEECPVTEQFRRRMESQCHEIELYRQQQLRETGRLLTLEEAAREWIERYAEDFARDHPPPTDP